jgi:putative inorganic carbon (HCO3(-)) transporter
MQSAAQPSIDARPGRRELGLSSRWIPWLCLLSAAPWLLFPELRTPYGWIGVTLLVAQQAVRLLDAEERRRRLDIDVAWPMVGIAAMAVVGLLVAPNYQASLSKFFGILFDIGVYAAIVSSLRTTRLGLGRVDRLWVAMTAYVIVGVLVATVAFLLSQPAFSSWDAVVALYEARPELPMEVKQLLGKVGLGSPHPNRVADVLALFLPCYLALLLDRPWHRSREDGARGDHDRLRGSVRSRWLLVGCSLALAWVGLVFLATLSRAAYFGMAIGVLFLLAYRSPRARLGLGLAASCLVLLLGLLLARWLVFGPSEGGLSFEAIQAAAQEVTLGRTASASGSLAWRLELWPMVIELIVQHPWTGIGLESLVPYIQDRHNAQHAHNLALQVALDLGLPGLACLLTMLAIALRSSFRTLREHRGTPHQAIAAGTIGALLAFLVATLADTIPVGSKAGVFFWALLGLAVCLPRPHRSGRQVPPESLAQPMNGLRNECRR